MAYNKERSNALKRFRYHRKQCYNIPQMIERITEPREVTDWCEKCHEILNVNYEFHRNNFYFPRDPAHKITKEEVDAIKSLNKIRGTLMKPNAS